MRTARTVTRRTGTRSRSSAHAPPEQAVRQASRGRGDLARGAPGVRFDERPYQTLRNGPRLVTAASHPAHDCAERPAAVRQVAERRIPVVDGGERPHRTRRDDVLFLAGPGGFEQVGPDRGLTGAAGERSISAQQDARVLHAHGFEARARGRARRSGGRSRGSRSSRGGRTGRTGRGRGACVPAAAARSGDETNDQSGVRTESHSRLPLHAPYAAMSGGCAAARGGATQPRMANPAASDQPLRLPRVLILGQGTRQHQSSQTGLQGERPDPTDRDRGRAEDWLNTGFGRRLNALTKPPPEVTLRAAR